MVTPRAKREAVAYLKTAHEVSERRACQTLGANRALVRYRFTRPPDTALRERLKSLAVERRRFGYRRLAVFLRREGFADNIKKIHRIYKEEKVNPLGGCLPILVQMPVFIALYWVLLSSVEMRNAPWIGWITDLSVKDPYYILPIVMTASTLLQTWLNPTPPDPVQAKMMWIMPMVFSVMFFVFPAGLVLYWITNNILSIAQQWFINRKLGVA